MSGGYVFLVFIRPSTQLLIISKRKIPYLQVDSNKQKDIPSRWWFGDIGAQNQLKVAFPLPQSPKPAELLNYIEFCKSYCVQRPTALTRKKLINFLDFCRSRCAQPAPLPLQTSRIVEFLEIRRIL